MRTPKGVACAYLHCVEVYHDTGFSCHVALYIKWLAFNTECFVCYHSCKIKKSAQCPIFAEADSTGHCPARFAFRGRFTSCICMRNISKSAEEVTNRSLYFINNLKYNIYLKENSVHTLTLNNKYLFLTKVKPPKSTKPKNLSLLHKRTNFGQNK